MTEIEKRAIRSLDTVKVPEKLWHGRRIQELALQLDTYPDWKLSYSQGADLWFLVWRYRRQIEDDEVVRKANEIVNGALSLEFK